MKKQLFSTLLLSCVLWISTQATVYAQYYYLSDESNIITLAGKGKDFRFSTQQEIGLSINDNTKNVKIMFKVDIFKPIDSSTERDMLFNCLAANTYHTVAYLGTYTQLVLPKEGETVTLATKGAFEMSGKSEFIQLPITIKNVKGNYYINIVRNDKLNLNIVPERYKPLLQGTVNYEFSGTLKSY
jgi:hypothetical protein